MVIAIKVSGYLSEKRICFLPPDLSKEEIFFRLVGSLDLPDPEKALMAILEREKTGDTLLESNIAIPHARLEGLTDLRAAIGISRIPSKVYVLFLTSSQDTKTHLLFLAGVASLFQTENLAQILSELADAESVIQMIKKVEENI